MRIEILDGATVVNTIEATPQFAEAVYPGRWRLAAQQDPVPVNPTEWLIDVGPFMDRFGASKMAVLTSTNATVRALIADIQVRKWIDLKRPDVAGALDALIALGISGMTPALKASILDIPVTAEENLALRTLYFGS